MAKDIVIEVLKKAEKPLRPGDIAKLGNLEKKDVDKAIKELKSEEIIHSPKRCFYDLKNKIRY
ncbi:MAG: MarR family transcriptional regulator [Bacteroidales bacterium]|nr:MarR family transcriptional regulator [Bacteroidales bacterium]